MMIIVELKLWCPNCGAQHVDETRNGERWDRRAHTTHRCQSCSKDFDVYVSGAKPVDAAPVQTAAQLKAARKLARAARVIELAEHVGACWAGRADVSGEPANAGS